MNRILTCCLLIWAESCKADFFHTSPYIEFKSENESSFGYSLAYQKKSHNLIVGAPHADLDGRVYSCSLGDTNNNYTCDKAIESKSVMHLWGDNKSRYASPNQHFCLGASVAVTPDYIFACAPLLTGNVTVNGYKNMIKTDFKAFGTCFIKSETSLQSYSRGNYLGTTGWSTLVDQENDIIIIAKPEYGNITYTSAKTPSQQTESMNWNGVPKGQYGAIGRALASGIFFSDYKTVYAFSMEVSNQRRRGIIAFLNYTKNRLQLITYLRQNTYISVNIMNKEEYGAMFGAALNAADFNQDGFSELLVGAPTHAYNGEYETGAVYIYLGGKKASRLHQTNICIVHNKEGSRFGTAIASADLDEDNLPELFVSAPYEDKGGAVYVISGFEIKTMLVQGNWSTCTLATKIPHQRISSAYNSFGFILQPALNFNENGANALAIGAPSVAKVFTYRSIPTITVNVSAHLKDKEIVRELDESFTVTVNVHVTYPSLPINISGALLVTTSISQDVGASINKNQNYTINLSRAQGTFTMDVIVNLSDQNPRTYKFIASVETNKTLLKETVFSDSLVRLSKYSADKKELLIQRRCKGDECVPRLSMELHGLEGNPDSYVLGSSSLEIFTVTIKNGGNSSYESCAKIRVAGAKMVEWQKVEWNCVTDEIQVMEVCKFDELKGHSEKFLSIHLDMSQRSSKDEKLEFEMFLYDKCSSANASAYDNKTVLYNLRTTEISINGSFLGRNVTDREVAEVVASPTVDIEAKYIVSNNGSVKWEDICTEILVARQPYIDGFVIVSPEPSSCYPTKNNDFFVHNCKLTVDQGSTVEILTTISITKDKIVQSLRDNKLQLSSELKLYLKPTQDVKNFTLVTTVTYQKDTTFGQNKTYILIVAIMVAIIILIVIGIILYKVGFFKRTVKDELDNLKEELVRERSIRQSRHPVDEKASTFELLQKEEVASEEYNMVQLKNNDEAQPNKKDEVHPDKA